MTPEDLKKIDRKVRAIEYPFGENYPLLRRVLADYADRKGTTISEVMNQYIIWKNYRPY